MNPSVRLAVMTSGGRTHAFLNANMSMFVGGHVGTYESVFCIVM